ncbi:hypothetical protein MTO96_020267 [Rhipicephalus appendiculatus]
MFSHPFYAQVLALSLLKACFNGFSGAGNPLASGIAFKLHWWKCAGQVSSLPANFMPAAKNDGDISSHLATKAYERHTIRGADI